ncbi:MAG TPA: tripartite tricarboxylate transporter substrate-binding protein, partial [Burkholderiales bacterium]|nr:tripartite tricarboxylate transporter substrate-binding protein [Burkholderiales bacterium]
MAIALHGYAAHAAVAAYPAKPIRVIVGLAPGGATDIQARWFAQKMSENLGRSFIIDNRTGAGGLIAYQLVRNAAPDGYTVVAATATFTLAAALQAKPPYDPVLDFAPISLVTKAPYLVVVHNSFPAKSMKEVIAFAKAKPGALLIAIPGTGTTNHLGGLWLQHATSTKITLVPYKGAGPSFGALLAGEVNMTFANVVSALPVVRSGRVRALAVTTAQRSPALADLPTVAESGVPGFDVNTWHGWLAPNGTPRSII